MPIGRIAQHVNQMPSAQGRCHSLYLQPTAPAESSRKPRPQTGPSVHLTF